MVLGVAKVPAANKRGEQQARRRLVAWLVDWLVDWLGGWVGG